LRTHDVPRVNALLAQQSLAPLTVPKELPGDPDCGK